MNHKQGLAPCHKEISTRPCPIHAGIKRPSRYQRCARHMPSEAEHSLEPPHHCSVDTILNIGGSENGQYHGTVRTRLLYRCALCAALVQAGYITQRLRTIAKPGPFRHGLRELARVSC